MTKMYSMTKIIYPIETTGNDEDGLKCNSVLERKNHLLQSTVPKLAYLSGSPEIPIKNRDS